MQGVGQEDSKIAVYETDEEERGVIAVEVGQLNQQLQMKAIKGLLIWPGKSIWS